MDYWALNIVTKDVYPLPCNDNTLDDAPVKLINLFIILTIKVWNSHFL